MELNVLAQGHTAAGGQERHCPESPLSTAYIHDNYSAVPH